MRQDAKKIITKTSVIGSSATLDRQTNNHINLDANVTITINSSLALPILSREFIVSGNLVDNKTAKVKHHDGTTTTLVGFIGNNGKIIVDAAGIPQVHADGEILNDIITTRATSMLNGGGIVEMYYDYDASEYKMSWTHRLIAIPGALHTGRSEAAGTGYLSISPYAAGISLGTGPQWKIVVAEFTDNQLKNSTGSINCANADVNVYYYTAYKHKPGNVIIATVCGDNGMSVVMGNGCSIEQFGRNATSTAAAKIRRESYCGCASLEWNKSTFNLKINRAMWIKNPRALIKSGYYIDLTMDMVINNNVHGWLVVYAKLSDAAAMGTATYRLDNSHINVAHYNQYQPRMHDWIIGYVNGDTDEFVMIGEGQASLGHNHVNDSSLHLTPADRNILSSIATPANQVPRASLVDAMSWEEVPFNTPIGDRPIEWRSLNGGIDENAIILETDPAKLLDSDHNTEELHWVAKATAVGGAAGGFISTNITVDPTKKYRFVHYVRNDGLTNSAARIYSGLYGLDNNNNKGVEYFHTGANTTNPYFWSGDFSTMDVWYAIVGHIHPTGTPLVPLASHEGGIYLVGDTTMTKQVFGNVYDFRFGDPALAVDTIRTRFYQYYPNAINDQKTCMSPTVELMDGTEGSLSDILLLPRAHINAGGTAKEGDMRYNPTTQKHEGYNGTVWTAFN